jgi:hypothetical protein
MSQKINLKEIERRVYLSYFEDGIIDMSIGLVILFFGLGMLMDTTLSSIFAAFVWIYWWSAKKLITIPRIGHVKFSRVRTKQGKRILFFFVILLTISFVLMTGLWFATANKSISPEVRTFLRRFPVLPLGIIFAVAMFALGSFIEEGMRYYSYALLVLLGTFGAPLVNLADYLHMILPGAAILVYGVSMLIRFLRKYPKPSEITLS